MKRKESGSTLGKTICRGPCASVDRMSRLVGVASGFVGLMSNPVRGVSGLTPRARSACVAKSLEVVQVVTLSWSVCPGWWSKGRLVVGCNVCRRRRVDGVRRGSTRVNAGPIGVRRGRWGRLTAVL